MNSLLCVGAAIFLLKKRERVLLTDWLTEMYPVSQYLKLLWLRIDSCYCPFGGWRKIETNSGTRFCKLYLLGALNSYVAFLASVSKPQSVFCAKLNNSPCVVLPVSKQSLLMPGLIHQSVFPQMSLPRTYLLLVPATCDEHTCKQLRAKYLQEPSLVSVGNELQNDTENVATGQALILSGVN
jgi:hypothetical protein